MTDRLGLSMGFRCDLHQLNGKPDLSFDPKIFAVRPAMCHATTHLL